MRALDGVTLSMPRGMYGLLGPNGAGKSTLMRIIATLQQPTSGRATFDGIDILVEPMRLRAMLGYLPQDFGVYPRVSAETLLDHIAVLKGIGPAKARREEVSALLHQTNLFDARKRAVASFSGGMRQRFGIAQALLGNPQLIIVDEPTAGLDPAERVRFHDLLSRIGEHAVVILSTHILEDVAELCKRMAIIVGGTRGGRREPELAGRPVARPTVAEAGRPRRGRGAAPAVQRDLDPLSRRAYSRIRSQRPSARRRIRAGRRGSGKRVFRDCRERHEGRSLN